MLETGSEPEKLLLLDMREEVCAGELTVTAEGVLTVNQEICLIDGSCEVYDEVVNFVDHSDTEYIFMRNLEQSDE